jgi:uncharacterized membrane protein
MLQLIWAMIAVAAAANLTDAFLARELSQAVIEDVVIGYASVGLAISVIILAMSFFRAR